jgi:hypothetical protein
MSGLISGVSIRSQDILSQGFTGDAERSTCFRNRPLRFKNFESESLMHASDLFR